VTGVTATLLVTIRCLMLAVAFIVVSCQVCVLSGLSTHGPTRNCQPDDMSAVNVPTF
jgi:hypothetical protein